MANIPEILFLSTLPARGATGSELLSALGGMISIHAPREGSDKRASCWWCSLWAFLSTLPARGATKMWTNWPTGSSNFYPRSPRGERRGGSSSNLICAGLFLSTLPARGATRQRRAGCCQRRISIHAPREGSDHLQGGPALGSLDFYPRSPRGERLTSSFTFLPCFCISIHAPREGSDRCPGLQVPLRLPFLSTLPARGATGTLGRWLLSGLHFYPRSPRGERPRTGPAATG